MIKFQVEFDLRDETDMYLLSLLSEAVESSNDEYLSVEEEVEDLFKAALLTELSKLSEINTEELEKHK